MQVAVCLALLTLVDALRMSTSCMAEEKQNHRLDILLATPLSASDFVNGKVAGLVRRVVPELLAVAFLFLIGAERYPSEKVMIFAVSTALCVSAALYVTMLGLWLSVRCRTAATAFVLGIALLLASAVPLTVVTALFAITFKDLAPFLLSGALVFMAGFSHVAARDAFGRLRAEDVIYPATPPPGSPREGHGPQPTPRREDPWVDSERTRTMRPSDLPPWPDE